MGSTFFFSIEAEEIGQASDPAMIIDLNTQNETQSMGNLEQITESSAEDSPVFG